MATFTSEVSAWYEAVQFRAPPAADLATYVAGLNSGSLSAATVQGDIISDPYTQDYVNPVIREFQAAFGRVPQQAGLSYWVNVVATDPTGLAQLNTVFANSTEFTALYGATATTPASVGLVNSLYENILGRPPQPAGLHYWSTQGLDAAQLLQAFAQSTEFIQDTNPNVAAFEQLELTGAEPTSGSIYQGDLGGPPTLSFTLTTGADTVNGYTNVTGDLSEFFFNGIGPTLNADDHITNVTNLTITDEYGSGVDIIPAGANIANVTNIILDTAGNAGGSALFDTSGITGVQTLTINSAGTEEDDLNASSTTAITVNHAGHDGDVTVTGGSTVTVTTSGSDGDVWVGTQEGGVDPTSTAGLPTGAVVVNENGSGETDIHVLGGTTVTVNVNSPSNSGYIDIGNTDGNTGDFTGAVAGATNPTGAIVVNDMSQYGGDLTFNDNAVITIFGGTTVNVTAAGDEIVVGDSSAYNPSNQPTGDVTIVNTGVQTLTDATYDGPGNIGNTSAYEDVYVNGGANVSVTSNTGDVFVGDTDLQLNAAGTAALAGTQPTGTVTIVDTATQDGVSVGVYGGTSVAINTATTVSAVDIQVGAIVTGPAGDVVVAPTGDVTIFDNAAKAWAGGQSLITYLETDSTGPEFVGTLANFHVGETVQVETDDTDGFHVHSLTLTAGDLASVGALAGALSAAVAGTDASFSVLGADLEFTDGTNNESSVGGLTAGAADVGIGHTIEVDGGANVNVTTNTAAVFVGGDELNTAGTAALAGENPTGAVTIVDNATAQDNDAGGTEMSGGISAPSVTVYGGTSVNVTAAGMDVTVGADVGGVVIAPSGAITVVDTATETVAYDDVLTTSESDVSILGGTTVNVTTNVGSVLIGEDGAAPSAGSEATGAITVVDNSTGDVDVYGGTDVTVTSAGGVVQVGDGANSVNSALTNPTGNVMVTMAAVETGWNFGTDVKVEGGVNVTVNTTGGDVRIGENNAGDGNTPVTGAVVVNNTYGGVTKDSVHVMGGTTVNITTSATRGDGTITVGNDPLAASPVLQNAAGTALLTTGDGSTADSPTGNVTIVDATVVSPTNTVYGAEAFRVLMNGGTTASITGGDGDGHAGPNIVGDVQSDLLTATDLAAGTSHLTTVNFTGVIGETIIGSDALTTLGVSNTGTGNTFEGNIYDDTANSALTLNLANATASIQDEHGLPTFAGPAAFIGSVVVNTTGSSASTLDLVATKATSLTFNDSAALALTSDPGSDLAAVTSIKVAGAGDLNLGDWSSSTQLLTINASAATGAVDVAINPELTSFSGGAGNDVVSITNPGEDFGFLLTSGSVTFNGGGGANTIYNLYDGSSLDLALGNIGFGGFQNFQDFGVAGGVSGTYNVEGFSGLVVGGLDVPGEGSGLSGVSGTVTFINVAQGASLDIVDNSDGLFNYGIAYELQTAFAKPGSVSITEGLDGATTGVMATVDLNVGGTATSTNIASVSIDSQGLAGDVNALTLQSDGGGATLALTSITITGDASLTLTADGNGELVSTIDASASSGAVVDVLNVDLAATGVTVWGGSGVIQANGVAETTAVDTFNIGSGGGEINVGDGGAGYNAGLGTNTGSETINLMATAPTGTWVQSFANVDGAGDGSFVIVNNWNHGTAGSGQTADALDMVGTPVVIANQTGVHEGSAIYNVSDGVISLAAGSPTASGSQQLEAAQAIVDLASVGTIAAITVPITTSPSGATTATFVIENEGGGGGPGDGNMDVFVELTGGLGGNALGFGGVAGLSGLPSDPGDIGAGASVTLLTSDFGSVFANLTDITDLGSTTANMTYTTTNDTVAGVSPGGLATIDNLAASQTGFTTTYDNLGNFGILQADTTAGDGGGNVVVTQIGIDPVLTLTAMGDVNLNHLTYGNSAVASDDPTLLLYAAGGSIDIATVIDASNTGTTVLIAGGHDVEIDGITDASLATVDASELDGHLILTAAGKGLTITGATADGDTITANGTGDMISVGSDAGVANTADGVSITANGVGDHISVVGGDTVTIGAAGAGDTINVADSDGTTYITGNGADHASPANLATQLGAGDTINVGDSAFGGDAHMWLGSNSTVNLSLTEKSFADIHLQGDTAGASLTNMTTITGAGVGHNGLTLHFNDTNGPAITSEAWAGGHVWNSQVNEASATSLASALDIAANQTLTLDQTLASGSHTTVVGQNTTSAAVQLNSHTGLLDWFQYSGNTYIVETANTTGAAAAHSGLGSGDVVVELTGIVDVSHSVHFQLA